MSSVFRPVDGENNTIIPCCVVIATAKANSNGQTSVIYAVKLNRSDGIEGDPFRLSNRGGRYIWINDTIHKERIKVGSIVKYREFGDLFIYEGNTKKRMNVDQIQMNLEYGQSAYKSIKEACPDARIGESKGIYLESQPEAPRIFLVSLKYGFIKNERVLFGTKGGEHVDLKLNCRENLSLSTSHVRLQLRHVTDEDDVGDVALIRFGTSECSLRYPIFPGVCEGLILKFNPRVISTDEEPVKIRNGNGKFILVPGTVKVDTGNDVATGISNKLVEMLDLEVDRRKRTRFNASGGGKVECCKVPIKVKIRGHVFSTDALVGAPAHGTDLLIGKDIIDKLHDENFTVGQ